MIGQHTRNSVRIGMLTPDQKAEFQARRRQAFQSMGRNEHDVPREVCNNLDDMIILAVESGRTDLVIDPLAWQAAIDKQREEEAYDRRRADEAARRRLTAENNPQAPPPAPTTLETLLARPDDPATYRVQGCLPIGACMMLVARAKSGKTRIITSLVRALVDGTPFLGKYRVEPVEFGVTIFDNEMDERMIRAWYRAAGIQNTHLVHIVPLRGQTTAFDILDPDKRFELVKLYEGSEVYILDALRPALDSFGLDENREAGRYVQAWKNFIYELGGEESVIVHHMGHSGERARGDSGLIGGVDGTWKILLQDPDDPGNKEADPAEATRFFSAYGRDVDEPEQQLGGPPEHMVVVGGTRREVGKERRQTLNIENYSGHALNFIKAHGGNSATDFDTWMSQNLTPKPAKGTGAKVFQALVAQGLMTMKEGRNNRRHYYLNDGFQDELPGGFHDKPPEASRTPSLPKPPENENPGN